MGMDCTTYKIKNVVFNEDDIKTRTLMLTDEQKQDFIQRFPKSIDMFKANELLNLEQIKIDFNISNNFSSTDWDFNNPALSWIKYVDYSTDNDINPEQVISIEDSSKYIYQDGWTIICEVEEIGYIRKPFRHYDTPTKNDDESITIYIDNFTGVDQSINEVLGSKACENCYLILNNNNLDIAKKLGNYCYDKEEWFNNVTSKLFDNNFTIIDW